MEHRYSDRLTSDLNIIIYKQNLLVAMGIVKNIGSEGVFIESGFAELCINQPLEIEFLSSDNTLKHRRFKAVVVHRTDMGFGAEIDDIAAQIKLASIANRSAVKRGNGLPVPTASIVDIGYATL